MRHAVTLAASFFLIVAGGAHAMASPCGDKIAALETKLNTSGSSTTGVQTAAADARTGKTRKLLEEAKAADQRGDSKGCDATVGEATREAGSAQQ